VKPIELDRVMRKLLILFVLALLPFGGKPAASARRAQPNIIWFMADDLGSGEIGPYGQRKIRTPALDRLAREGMRFTNAYAGAPVCMPSRCTLMLGKHTGHTPNRTNFAGFYLHPDDLTVAEHLRAAGYTCGLFGKWGLGNVDNPGRPDRQGFAAWAGQLDQVHAHFQYPYWIWEQGRRRALPENEGGKRGSYVTDWVQRRALEFVRRNADRPFFLYAACTLPHVELAVPEDSERPYRGRFPRESVQDPRPGYLGSEDGLATLAGMVTRMDRYVGELMALLRELDLERDTLFIFTSDNGPLNGGKDQGWTRVSEYFDARGPFRGYKGELYEGGLRVPLLARWPGHIPPGTIYERPVAFWDFFPTACQVAGIPAPNGLDGVSFAAFDPAAEAAPGRALYWEVPGPGGSVARQAVRQGRWKLHRTAQGKRELYDLEADVGETRDLSTEHPVVTARLTGLLDRLHTPIRHYDRVPASTVRDYVR
jgi:arylsulfatase A-like enzyme